MSLKNAPTFLKKFRKSGSRPQTIVRASGRNLRLTIEYDGTGYAGWQCQKSHRVSASARHQCKTIQETIEATLQKILQEKVKVIAAGRTDAGVHALGQVANFRTSSALPLDKLQRGLNALLPDDIAISAVKEAKPQFHSRFAAKSKVYRYAILNRPHRSAILRNKAYFYPYPLNLKLMQKESRILLGKHNFKAFQASDKKIAFGDNLKALPLKGIGRPTLLGKVRFSVVRPSFKGIGRPILFRIRKVFYPERIDLPKPIKEGSYTFLHHKKARNPVKTIKQLKIVKDNDLIYIDIEADGFLYNMARNIVGTLIEIGRGKFAAGSLKKILLARDRKLAGPTAPASGLSLLEVKY